MLTLDEIFTDVKTRVKNRINSLNSLDALNNRISFEGWLKVETINALGQNIYKIQNRGTDVKFNDGSKIELKASMDKIHKGFFFRKIGNKYDGKYECPVLLIAGDNIEHLKSFGKRYKMNIIQAEALNNLFVIALVVP